MDVAEAPAASGDAAAAKAVPVSVPQIAYTYSYAFDVPENAIAPVQDRHVALCDRLGPNGCRVLGMQRQAADDHAGIGMLKLSVRADLARAFGRALAGVATRAGGRQADAGIEAEDLSKQIVDTEARLRSKQALADRLMELLRTRSGPVADLVAAERSVAAAQEEIDAARSWLAEARGRVAMSVIDVTYEGDGLGHGFLAPLHESIASMGSLFGVSLALLVRLVAGALPWAMLAAAIAWGVRRWRLAVARREPLEG